MGCAVNRYDEKDAVSPTTPDECDVAPPEAARIEIESARTREAGHALELEPGHERLQMPIRHEVDGVSPRDDETPVLQERRAPGRERRSVVLREVSA
jgi:hypothetical protein